MRLSVSKRAKFSFSLFSFRVGEWSPDFPISYPFRMKLGVNTVLLRARTTPHVLFPVGSNKVDGVRVSEVRATIMALV
jgi:hypothetical protein